MVWVAPSQIVETPENPVEITGLLVVDIRLPRSLRGPVRAARLIGLGIRLVVGPASRIVLRILGDLLCHASGLDLLTAGTGRKTNRQQNGQYQGDSDHGDVAAPQ